MWYIVAICYCQKNIWLDKRGSLFDRTVKERVWGKTCGDGQKNSGTGYSCAVAPPAKGIMKEAMGVGPLLMHGSGALCGRQEPAETDIESRA